MLGLTRTILLYRIAQLICFPIIVVYFAARLVTDRSYWSRFGERLGLLPQSFTRTKPGCIWLHAVSAGEVASAIPLIRTLQSTDPLVPIYLSTATVAGRAAAELHASALVDGIFYAPIDYASCIRRAIRALRPALLIVLETEIWPNLYHEIRESGAQIAIVNGRISNRTWPQYRRMRWFFEPVLQIPELVCVQSAVEYDRYAALGVCYSKLETLGNLKFDASMSPVKNAVPTFGAEHICICASTCGPNERGSTTRHSIDEDEIAIRVFQALARDFPRLLLILAPRQPSRFDEVAGKLTRSGVNFLRRSQIKAQQSIAVQLPAILLLDTIGELAGAYSVARAVFVGGSLAPRGGHNIMEPAAAAAAIVVGPHMENFAAVTAEFIQANAIMQVQNERELIASLRSLLLDRAQRTTLGTRARELIERHRGTAQRVAHRLWPVFHSASLKPRRNLFARSLLGLLAYAWRYGGALRRQRFEHYAASVPPLGVPVISIGAITAGGSGKTPFTTYVAAQLRERRYRPAILTRGYRRSSPARDLVFATGAKVPIAFTGDEAQIFLRHSIAPIGIGGNRYETAQVLRSQFPRTDVFLLDDGFQHARLKRDFDVVIIDGLDPFGGGNVIPAGRLREPLTALNRADAFVITRAQDDLRYEAICRRLRQYNSNAPCFRTRLVARNWRDYRTGECLESLAARRVAGFCGLGNPQNFWSTLESLGLQVVFRWAFGDHHAYKSYELQRLAHQARTHGAELLVTTEKDRINCPNHFEKAIAPLDLAWLEIELELEEEARFFHLLEPALGPYS